MATKANLKTASTPDTTSSFLKDKNCIVQRDVNSICQLCVNVSCDDDHLTSALAAEIPDPLNVSKLEIRLMLRECGMRKPIRI